MCQNWQNISIIETKPDILNPTVIMPHIFPTQGHSLVYASPSDSFPLLILKGFPLTRSSDSTFLQSAPHSKSSILSKSFQQNKEKSEKRKKQKNFLSLKSISPSYK